MKLFKIIPGNFFSILVSGNREIYFEAIMALHNLFRFELNIRVDDFLSALIAILEDQAFDMEAEDDVPEGSQTLSGKARLILDRLVKTGWIDKEFLDSSFIEIITPKNYAIPVMRLLSELGDNSLHEYNSLVFATYSGLKQAKTEDKPHLYEALLSAKSNTEHLQYSLRTLYHAIRGFMRAIAPEQNINTLLQDHFQEYKQMSDRIYHPIKTMDSVHRYMLPIRGLLAEIRSDEDLLQTMRERAMSVKNYDETQADEEIIGDIDYITDFYQAVGNLVSEIDRKHSSFTRSSIEKIQYLMTADHTIKGKLAEVLTLFAGGTTAKRDKLLDLMNANIHAGRQEFFDAKSLYHKSVRSRRVNRDALQLEQKDETAKLAKDFLLNKITEGYTTAKIKKYIDSLIPAGEKEISSDNISINSESEFIMLILVMIRQGESGLPYKVQLHHGQFNSNGYGIPNMTIKKN